MMHLVETSQHVFTLLQIVVRFLLYMYTYVSILYTHTFVKY